MKRFVLYFLMTILFTVVIDGGCRIVLNIILNNIPNNTSHLSKVNKSLSVKNVDFIVVGMSTAEHNYNIAILEDTLQMRGYNCGSDGRNVFYDYMAVRNAIEHNNNLKLVIVDIGRGGLTNIEKDRINIVYPFYWKNHIVREVTRELKGAKMDFYMLSSLYQLNSGVENLWRLYHPLFANEYNGYTPYLFIDGKENTLQIKTNTDILSVDRLAVEYLEKIINVCKKNNVTVVLVTSPSLINDEETSSWLLGFCLNHQVEYWDFSKRDEIITDTKLFKDHYHLNENGANKFSKILVELIKSLDIKLQ